MLDAQRWLNVSSRLEFNTLSFSQKINKQLKCVKEALSYRPRNENDFMLQQMDKSAMQKSLYYKGLDMYNKIPNYLKNERKTL